MKIAIVLTPPTEHHFRLAAQIGVEEFVARYQWADSYDKLAQTCEMSASYGLKTNVVEGYMPLDPIVHNGAEREEAMATMKQLVRNMGKLGVEVLCYNWMPNCDWTRTALRVPARGGALTNAFDESMLQALETPPKYSSTREQLWSNLESFLKEILPVAEEANVKLAMHPDDPPVPSLRGEEQMMHQPEHYERLFNISDSPSNTMCFCQGTFSEMGADVSQLITRFGSKISYVHFRDVQGVVPQFVETFHDNGQKDMAAAMRAYRDVGFAGPARPDHVPTLDGEEGDGDGYSMLGRLFAVGYMRGLLHAVESEKI
jgi:mannonate dehydratase